MNTPLKRAGPLGRLTTSLGADDLDFACRQMERHGGGRKLVRTEQERGADRRNREGGDCAPLGEGMRMTQSGGKELPANVMRLPGNADQIDAPNFDNAFVQEYKGRATTELPTFLIPAPEQEALEMGG